MKFGKRQLILGTLVLALGAAVYLSWMLSGNHQLLSTGALSSSGGNYGEAEYVNASETGTSSEEVYDIDDVMNGLISSQPSGENASSIIAAARLSRQQARDNAEETLEDIVKAAKSPDDVKSASDKATKIANDIVAEANIESLIKAKGYTDCVCVITDDKCNVIVTIDTEMPNDAVIIKNVVNEQSGIAYENIKIVGVK